MPMIRPKELTPEEEEELAAQAEAAKAKKGKGGPKKGSRKSSNLGVGLSKNNSLQAPTGASAETE